MNSYGLIPACHCSGVTRWSNGTYWGIGLWLREADGGRWGNSTFSLSVSVNEHMVDTWTIIRQHGLSYVAPVQWCTAVQVVEVLQVPATWCCPSSWIKALLIEKPWLPQNSWVPTEEVPLITSICSVIFVCDDIMPWTVSRASPDSEPLHFLRFAGCLSQLLCFNIFLTQFLRE